MRFCVFFSSKLFALAFALPFQLFQIPTPIRREYLVQKQKRKLIIAHFQRHVLQGMAMALTLAIVPRLFSGLSSRDRRLHLPSRPRRHPRREFAVAPRR